MHVHGFKVFTGSENIIFMVRPGREVQVTSIKAETDAVGKFAVNVFHDGRVSEPVVSTVVVDSGGDGILFAEFFHDAESGFPLFRIAAEAYQRNVGKFCEFKKTSVPSLIRLCHDDAETGNSNSVVIVVRCDLVPSFGFVVVDVGTGQISGDTAALSDRLCALGIVFYFAEREGLYADKFLQVKHFFLLLLFSGV